MLYLPVSPRSDHKFPGGEFFTGGEETWDTVVGGGYRKHKFQWGVFFTGEETSVTPLVAAEATEIYIPNMYTAPP